MTDRVAVELTIDMPDWERVSLHELAQRACVAGAEVCEIAVPCEVSLLATSSARMSELNAQFRNKNTPTNVLSWPSEELSAGKGIKPHQPHNSEIGDIALSYETCVLEAAEQKKSLHDHATHLVLHGFLHLLGYDHEDDADATLMESLEIRALETLGIENPY